MARKSRKISYLLNQGINEPVGSNDTNGEQTMEALPTGAYIRLSAENSGNATDDTLQTQITLVESFIKERTDLYLADTYIDNGYTGTNFERPEFIRMMEDVKKGVIRCIVVKDLSRFGRNYLETGYYLENIFPLINVRFIAITDDFDSSRETDRNNLAIPIKNMVNAMYAKDFSRKQEAFHEMCKKTGTSVKRAAPYGYVYSEESGRFIIDKEVEPYVRLVFAWTLAGVSRSEIARRMVILEAPTASSKNSDKEFMWTASTVKAILFNPVYAGFHVMGKSRVSMYRGIKPTKIDRNDWIYFPDFHEAYITMDDYKAVEELISKSKAICYQRMERHAESRERMKDCFSGMVFCAECGHQMNFCRGSHYRDYRERSFQYYRCRYDKNHRQCSHTFVQQNFLKIIVMDQLRALIRTACEKNKILSSLETKYRKGTDLNPMNRNIARLTEKEKLIGEKLMKAYVNYTDGLIDEDLYQTLKSKYLTERDEVISKRKQFEQRLFEAERSVHQFQNIVDKLDQYVDGTDFREELVQELVSKIIVGKDNRIELVLKCQDVFENPLLDEYMGKEADNV